MEQLKTKSLSLNYILYNFRTVLEILIPLITFPYITRVLGPDSLGKVGYAESILGYFIIFSQLGVPSYGTREIARVRDSLHNRSCTFWELTIFLAITTVFAVVSYFCTVLSVPKFHANIVLYLVIFPNLIFNNFNYEWFYQGVEDQSFITIRFIIIKILQIVAIFLLIKNAEQFVLYATISVGLTSISAIMNIVHIRKYVSFEKLSSLHIKRHVRAILVIFASVVGIQINRILDITMIGSMIDDRSVSIYKVANQIVMIARSLILGITVTMTPRIENLFAKGDLETYKKYLNVSLHFALMLALPMVAGIILLSPSIIAIIAGEQYLDSILSMQLLSPIILIVNIANIIVSLILYPNRKEIKYTIAISVGAFANLVFNFFMIPVIGHNGAIIGTVIAETICLLISTFFALPYLKQGIIARFGKELCKYIIATAAMIILILFTKRFISNLIVLLVVDVALSIPFYFTVLFIFKAKYLIDFKTLILTKIGKGKNNE